MYKVLYFCILDVHLTSTWTNGSIAIKKTGHGLFLNKSAFYKKDDTDYLDWRS